MKSKEKKPMSLKRKILSVTLKVLVVMLCLVIVAVAVFAILFKDTFLNIVKNPSLIPYVIENWDSLSKGLKTSTDELDAEVKANAEAQAKAFAEADINLSESDIGNLSDKSLTEKERAEIIYNAMTSGTTTEQSAGEPGVTTEGPTTQEPQPDKEKELQPTQKPDDTEPEKTKDDTEASDKTPEKKEPENTPSVKPALDSTVNTPVASAPSVDTENTVGKMTEEQYNMRVSELVAKMYSIKADFMSQLSAFESRIISEYKALPEEQRTSATKSRIVSDNMSYVMGLEAQCDAQVKAVTDELTALMTANGKPTTLVEQINAAYISEKEIKKAYYVSLYK